MTGWNAFVSAIEMVSSATGHAISPIAIGVTLLLIGIVIIVYGMRETVGAIVGVFLPRGAGTGRRAFARRLVGGYHKR